MDDEVSSIRMAEVTVALSLATDLGTGQPMDHALRTCALSMKAAEAVGLDDATRSCLYYVALLRFLGCTSDASDVAVIAGGDDVTFNATMAPILMASAGEGDAILRAPSRRGSAGATAGGQDRQGAERSGLGEPQLIGSLRGRSATRPTARPGRRRLRCARARLRALGRQGASRRSGRRGGAGGGPHRRGRTRRRAVHPPLRLAGSLRRAGASTWARLRPDRRRRPRR